LLGAAGAGFEAGALLEAELGAGAGLLAAEVSADFLERLFLAGAASAVVVAELSEAESALLFLELLFLAGAASVVAAVDVSDAA
jgi:hypothetical protein